MILAHVEVGENIRNVAIRINRYFQRTIRKNRVSFIVWGRAVVQIRDAALRPFQVLCKR